MSKIHLFTTIYFRFMFHFWDELYKKNTYISAIIRNMWSRQFKEKLLWFNIISVQEHSLRLQLRLLNLIICVCTLKIHPSIYELY